MFNLERIMQLDIEYVKSFSEVEVCKEGSYFTIRLSQPIMMQIMHRFGERLHNLIYFTRHQRFLPIKVSDSADLFI